MTTNLYAYWRQELKTPGQSRDTADTPTDGFYRAKAAKTKPDYGVAIWRAPEGEVIQIGNRQITGDSSDGHDFRDGAWQHCEAVTKEVYDAAMETGFWPDGKNARKMSDEERMGIDISAGDNAAPIEESLADQIATLAEKIDGTVEPTTQDQANTLSGLLDKMRALLKLAEAQRVTEKEPFLQGSRDVDAKWKAIGEPGGNAYRAGEERRKAFLKKEQARLDAIAAEERRKQQAIIDAENERIRQENEKRAAEAAEAGEPEPAPVMPEISAPAVEAQRATAGSTFGRSSGLRKVTVVDTVDVAVLTKHFIDSADEDFATYLNTRAAKAVRAKVKLPGVTTKEELQ